jgi:hypothetical protein
MSKKLDAATLPIAIGNLLSMNNYDVEYDVHIHGAQVDIVAKSKGDPFANPLYIEATIEYVSTEKYGKDSTKFLLLSRKHPQATLLCISSVGFTAPIKERAKESGVTALTYDELFSKFEKFSPYLSKALSDESTKKLVRDYEEPSFSDSKGTEAATKWLGYWKAFTTDDAKWLIILGEYGTGKTSLTKVIQHRWLEEYKSNPSLPLPIRIELRNFSRQFDARGLLHHFLDTNDLGHVPIDFMMHLIRTGRAILLLDGYDEMAQFMNARERRACLTALAELASDGAKGLLTSRPNYFSETEELNVFEALYRSLEQQHYHLSKGDTDFIDQERSVDQLVERYVLNRYERSLQDLTPMQTESLVKRILKNNERGQEVVLAILSRVFRSEQDGGRQALSGKPVIIAYLLELVEEIGTDSDALAVGELTEWQIYKLIIDRLMLRDLRRSSLNPNDRRRVLQKLALRISGRDEVVASEATFNEIIDEEFQADLRRLTPEERRTRRVELFEDLRSSATLTRATGTKQDGWVFSHNSLREFLVTEMFLSSLDSKRLMKIDIPITSAMRGFAAAIGDSGIETLWQFLVELWPQRDSELNIGYYLTLLWDALNISSRGIADIIGDISNGKADQQILLNDVTLKNIDFRDSLSCHKIVVNAAGSTITEVNFGNIDLSNSKFDGAILDTVLFSEATLDGCSFKGALLFECDLSNASVVGADFTDIDRDSNVIVSRDGGSEVLSGQSALGYLKFHGAVTSPVEDIHVFLNHPLFSILGKIAEKVSEQKHSQLRGLTQRGESRADPPFARALILKMVSWGWMTIGRNDLVSATPEGRPILARIAAYESLPREAVDFFKES